VWYERRPFVKVIGENPSQWRGGVIDDEQIVVAPCPSSSLMSPGGGSHVETAEKNHLRLAVDMREVVVGVASKLTKRTTSRLRLDVRKEVVVGVTLK